MPEQITLYGNKVFSVFSHRVSIALKEAGAEHKEYVIDTHSHKPTWYSEKVNPITRKIPCITYGGPDTDPADPSPESHKIHESLVISEFIADLYPDAHLVPSDPLQRANMRLFIALWEQQGFPAFWSFLTGTGSTEAFLGVFEALQARLAPSGFAVGQFSLADIAVAPFVLRTLVLVEHEIGKYPLGDGKKLLDAMKEPKFARMAKYIEDLTAYPSVRDTWAEDAFLAGAKNPAMQRN
ncbi:thioredoxin-like protein [Epithele typhae]|uniref:thioredoxin-like protein n=1 Tax=Epithele typhae TaxID=378194 RepID=UPI002008489A|nr:thioredoxin-like protein [Epithele typhae]KAH9917893.1 thioredoxin-like protein [Epithele typhae]